MAFDTAWLKSHWIYIAGAFIGVFVLYEIFSSAASSSAGGSSATSGSSDQEQSLQAAADLQDAQVNGQVETASYAADVQNNETAAALQLGEVQTAAELAATQGQTTAAVEENTTDVSGAVEAERLVTSGQVQQTQIEGSTLESIAKTAGSTQTQLAQIQNEVPLAQVADVNSQIQNIQTYSKNAKSDYAAIAPVLAEETGQGSTVGAAKPTAGSTTAQNITAGANGINKVLSGLFA